MQEKHDDSGLSSLPRGKAGLVDLPGSDELQGRLLRVARLREL